jgi:hypothetical protein
MSLYLQYFLIGLIVLASVGYLLRKLIPGFAGRWQADLAAVLNQPTRSRAARALGRFLQPASKASGCGSGCNACDGCGAAPDLEELAQERPIVLHRPHN